MNHKEAFDFVFGPGLKYVESWLSRNSMGSLLLNLSQFGIEGNDKRDLSAGDVAEHIISRHYSNGYAFLKKGSKYQLFYLWSKNKGSFDEREIAQKEMKAKSQWFFEILKIMEPKLVYVHLGPGSENLGMDIGSVNRISDIPERIKRVMGWGDEHRKPNRDDVFIRVKANTSKTDLYSVRKDNWPQVRKYFEKLRIEYKTLDINKILSN